MYHSSTIPPFELDLLRTLVLRGSVIVYVTPKVGEDPHWQDEHVEVLEGSKGTQQLIECLQTYTDFSIAIDVGSIYDSKRFATIDDLKRLKQTFIDIWGDREHPEYYT